MHDVLDFQEGYCVLLMNSIGTMESVKWLTTQNKVCYVLHKIPQSCLGSPNQGDEMTTKCVRSMRDIDQKCSMQVISLATSMHGSAPHSLVVQGLGWRHWSRSPMVFGNFPQGPSTPLSSTNSDGTPAIHSPLRWSSHGWGYPSSALWTPTSGPFSQKYPYTNALLQLIHTWPYLETHTHNPFHMPHRLVVYSSPYWSVDQ